MGPKQEIFVNGQDYTSEVNEFLERTGLGSVAPGRCSSLLHAQLFCDAEIARLMNPYKVLDQLRALEGQRKLTQTKSATQFKHPPLKGLWHKHYMADGMRSMAINLRQGLKSYGLPHMDRLVAEAEESGEDSYLSEQDIAAIVDDAVMGNYMRRAQAAALTGDWIVFAQHEGLNYYLCIAPHEAGDHNIREQIDRVCIDEFPFLKDILVQSDGEPVGG